MTEANIVTTYTDSKGVTTPVTELNNFHLVNALIKTAKEVMAIEFETIPINGHTENKSQERLNDLEVEKGILKSLKDEVLRRLAPPAVTPAQ